jgi:undecaprenyl-diphosphatase
VDYRIYHAINQFVLHHAWLGRGLNVMETWAVPAIAVATFALWLFARPSGDRKWKLASASALAGAAIALLVNQAIGKIWNRQRPFTTHPSAHVWGSRSHDPSFPSDHASAAFAIAFAVFLFDRLVGSVFLAAAVFIGVGRVFIGAHYPADVLAGALVGFAVALVIVKFGRFALLSLIRIAERVTDPLVAPFGDYARTERDRFIGRYLPELSLYRVNELRRKVVPAQLLLLGALALLLVPGYLAWVLWARIAQSPGLQLPRRQAAVVIFVAALVVALGSALLLDSQLD